MQNVGRTVKRKAVCKHHGLTDFYFNDHPVNGRAPRRRCVECSNALASHRPEAKSAWYQKYRKEHPERGKLSARMAQERRKAEIIREYGGKCVCCGEWLPQLLTIDHINNDGAQHRQEVPGVKFYVWLREHGYPKDRFQLLCFNCNCGKRVNGGVCPHESFLRLVRSDSN